MTADDTSTNSDGERTDSLSIPEEQADDSPRSPVLLVVAGARAGLTIPVGDDPIVIGRAQHCAVWMDGSGISREHLRVARNSLGLVTITDLQSTNGTFVNRERIESQTLSPGDQVQLGPETVLKFEYQTPVEEQYHAEHYEQGIKDNLTGLYDRRHFLAKLREEMVHVLRERRPACVIKIGVDNVSAILEQHGYEAVEMVLRRMAKVLSMGLRNQDLLARWGEKKFAVLVHGGELEIATATAERLRKAVANYVMESGGQQLTVTISAGVAGVEKEDLADMQDLLTEVDEYLTRARTAGGNLVVGPTSE